MSNLTGYFVSEMAAKAWLSLGNVVYNDVKPCFVKIGEKRVKRFKLVYTAGK